MKIGRNYKEFVPFADDPSDPQSIKREDFDDEESFLLVLQKAWEKVRSGDFCESYQQVGDFEISVHNFQCYSQYYAVKIRWDEGPDTFCYVVFSNHNAAKRQFDGWIERASKFTKDTG
jgi:hypothetical protein